MRHLDAMLAQFDAYTASLEKEGHLRFMSRYSMLCQREESELGTTYPMAVNCLAHH